MGAQQPTPALGGLSKSHFIVFPQLVGQICEQGCLVPRLACLEGWVRPGLETEVPTRHGSNMEPAGLLTSYRGPGGNHKASYDQASEDPECYFCTFCWSSKSQAQIRIKFRECRPHLLYKDWKRICGYVLVNYTSFSFWLHWVCIAACRLSQVAVSRCCLPCGGVSCCRVLAVGHSGFSSYRARA